MSRIHEALKKAAEEKSSRLLSAASADIMDVAEVTRTTEIFPPATLLPKVQEIPKDGGRLLLSFEQLVQKCTHPTWRLDSRSSVFHGEETDKTGAERFRTLRSRLYQIAGTRTLKKVLITSSIPAEGKTFVAANLAQSIVRQNDRRVLLIDADLRASRLHLALGAPSSPGLTDYLQGEADEFAVMQSGLDGNLCFIPGGSLVSNPSELLLGERMKQLLEMVTPIFDWIIIDSPPALPVHDASMLADLCDGVLFVVRAGYTDFELAEKASTEFHEKNLLGVVLNCVEKSESYGEYYYGYGAEKDKS
ncbi:MAG TPA: CpsD/CapB family tyrosine-protein kinase [Candidatus Acidoferrum sp.]|jgi:capsular exopolysaccharide synthesis family protein